mgnify:CR=1 FL=1
MKKVYLFGYLVCFVFLSACSSKGPAKYDESLSFAMNTALSTGLTRRAGPISDIEVSDDMVFTDIDGLYFGASGYLASSTKFASSDSIRNLFWGVGLLNYLNNERVAAGQSHWIVWVPETAANKDKAREYAFDLWLAAYQKNLPKGYQLKHVKKYWEGMFTTLSADVYYLEGNGCPKLSDEVLANQSIYYREMQEREPNCFLFLSSRRRVESKTVYMPAWMGAGIGSLFGQVEKNKFKTKFPYLVPPAYAKNRPDELSRETAENFFLNMSKDLPNWMVYYSAPSKDGVRAPFMIQGGSVHPFMKTNKEQR